MGWYGTVPFLQTKKSQKITDLAIISCHLADVDAIDALPMKLLHAPEGDSLRP